MSREHWLRRWLGNELLDVLRGTQWQVLACELITFIPPKVCIFDAQDHSRRCFEWRWHPMTTPKEWAIWVSWNRPWGAILTTWGLKWWPLIHGLNLKNDQFGYDLVNTCNSFLSTLVKCMKFCRKKRSTFCTLHFKKPKKWLYTKRKALGKRRSPCSFLCSTQTGHGPKTVFLPLFKGPQGLTVFLKLMPHRKKIHQHDPTKTSQTPWESFVFPNPFLPNQKFQLLPWPLRAITRPSPGRPRWQTKSSAPRRRWCSPGAWAVRQQADGHPTFFHPLFQELMEHLS